MGTLASLSLRAKIMASVAVVALALSAVVVVFVRDRLQMTLREGLRERGVAEARDLAARSVDLILTYNTLELHQLAHDTQDKNRDVRYVFIVDSRGRLLVHTFEAGFPYDLLEANHLPSGERYHAQALSTNEGPVLDVAAPIYDGKAGTAHLGLSYHQLEQTVADTIRWLLVATGGVLVAGLGLAYAVATLITRPIDRLIDTAQAVGKGHLEQRARIASSDEIGKLGAAFDAMATDLERSRDELLRRNTELLALQEVIAAMNSSRSREEVLRVILRGVTTGLGYERATLALVDERDGRVKGALSAGHEATLQGIDYSVENDSDLSAVVCRTGKPVVVQDAAGDERIPREVTARLGLKEVACVPIKTQAKVLGLIAVDTPCQGGTITEERVRSLAAFADQAAAAIENVRLLDEASKVEALRQMDRLRSEFVARASHELRTPVTSLKGYVETLLREDMEIEAALRRELLADMDQISDRLARLVRDLLSVSRIDLGRVEVKSEATALRPLLQRVMRRFRAQVPGHQFRLKVAPDLPEVLADADRLEDVLDNLLSNAVKYSPKGSTVMVEARPLAEGDRDGSQVLVSVADQGSGIPVGEQAHLFERFYQRGGRAGGLGLGLFICKTYLEAMGGRIWLQPDGMARGLSRARSGGSRGAVFCFSLLVISHGTGLVQEG